MSKEHPSRSAETSFSHSSVPVLPPASLETYSPIVEAARRDMKWQIGRRIVEPVAAGVVGAGTYLAAGERIQQLMASSPQEVKALASLALAGVIGYEVILGMEGMVHLQERYETLGFHKGTLDAVYTWWENYNAQQPALQSLRDTVPGMGTFAREREAVLPELDNQLQAAALMEAAFAAQKPKWKEVEKAAKHMNEEGRMEVVYNVSFSQAAALMEALAGAGPVDEATESEIRQKIAQKMIEETVRRYRARKKARAAWGELEEDASDWRSRERIAFGKAVSGRLWNEGEEEAMMRDCNILIAETGSYAGDWLKSLWDHAQGEMEEGQTLFDSLRAAQTFMQNSE